VLVLVLVLVLWHDTAAAAAAACVCVCVQALWQLLLHQQHCSGCCCTAPLTAVR
jgi:hypothetical protein